MACPGCGTDNRLGRRFCVECGTALQAVCGACGAPIDTGDRFCGECGAGLAAGATPSPSPTAPARRVSERRLVSVLFADLVGFTTLSEHRDPEQVRDLLSRYFERCRTVIERYGGTVEKFIGDAVMAVWGTPVAREDDAERAVRAALALTQIVSTLGEEIGISGLRVRAGILTGRAAVEVGADHEGMVLGDTVNTASRLQSIAAPGTVLVDDVTRRASEAAVVYQDSGVHQVKGREQPVRAWTALRVVAGARGARRSAGLEAPFVGRDRELELIVESAEASAEQGRAALVAVMGDAGSGKSRLLWEFFKYVDGVESPRWWHQGRCLSYGEGIGYWAIAEMIRSRAGIVEDEELGTARAKLRAVVETHVPDERERRLVEPRLAHLLGLGQRKGIEAADLFSGWRLFFERLSEQAPVILAFEDLQWADSGLLEFIEYLLEWSAEYPIFVLALGRPEMQERRADWGATVRLEALPASAMQTLLDGVVPGLPAELTARILERAEGVPLYAVETVRMLLDRGVLSQEGSRYVVSGTVADLEVPETLHALIAARLDNLAPDDRGLLQDASVLGMSFSAEALAAVSGGSEATVASALDALVTKQVLGRHDDPRAGDPGQYGFLQALLRTIALGTLSHRDRKARHLAAAEFLRSNSEDLTDIAEVLASHYLAAVDADPAAPDADAIRASARETLAAAGHRAVSLALGVEARRYFEQAASLARDEAEQASLLAEAGAAAARTADREAARRLLGDAIKVLDASGRTEEAARTRAMLAHVLIAENHLEEAGELIDHARQSLTGEEVLAELAARRAQVAFLSGDSVRAREEAEVALSIADPRGLKAVMADAAQTKGAALFYENRLTESVVMTALGQRLAQEVDLTDQALRGYFNVSELRLMLGEPRVAGAMVEEGLALARERGNRAWERDLLAQRVGVHAFSGEWDQALALTEAMTAAGTDDSARLARTYVPLILSARGDTAGLAAWLQQPAAPSEWHELALVESVARAVALRGGGRLETAVPTIVASAHAVATISALTNLFHLGWVIDSLIEAEQVPLLEELLVGHSTAAPGMGGEWQRARGLLHARAGDWAAADAALAGAVGSLREAGNPFALGRALLDHATTLVDLGQPGRAAAAVQEASTIFRSLRAVPWIERSERLADTDGSPSHTGPPAGGQRVERSLSGSNP